MHDFCMPSLGADMDNGTLVEWRVSPGDHVSRGDIVAVVETQKAAMEIEFFDSGTIAELMVKPGDKVAVGAVIARFRADTDVPEEEKVAAKPRTHLRMSPAARRRARELSIDPSVLEGSGPHGAIVLRDVVTLDEATRADEPRPEPTPQEVHPEPRRRMAVPSALVRVPTTPVRSAISAAMTRSKRDIPHYYLAHTITMKRALAWLKGENAERPVGQRILPAAVLLKSVAAALWDVPELNGIFVDGQLHQSEAVQLGTAIALRGGGVIAPAIPDAEQKSVDETMSALRDLVHRARKGELKQSELTGPTITVTSLGERGSEVVYGVINPPQVAMVGFGATVERPWAEDGQLAVHPIVTVTLAADHRVSDGHRGALFLASIDRHLQSPEEL